MEDKQPDKKDFTIWTGLVFTLGVLVGSGATGWIATRPKRKIKRDDE
jgi:hypothetical protein